MHQELVRTRYERQEQIDHTYRHRLCDSQGSSTCAGLWLEDAASEQAAHPARVAAAQLLDAAYAAATLGLGVIVSLCMRCCTAARASVGERMLGLQLVQETSEPLL